MSDPRTDEQIERRFAVERSRAPEPDEARTVAAASPYGDDLAGPRRVPLRLVPRLEN